MNFTNGCKLKGNWFNDLPIKGEFRFNDGT